MTERKWQDYLCGAWPMRLVVRMAVGRLFHRYFEIVPATSDALRDEVFRIRYDVYCDELGWEEQDRYPDGREMDEYDRHAFHCLLLHKPSATYAGCVRLVHLPRDEPGIVLPFEDACAGRLYPEADAIFQRGRDGVGEISRLAVRSRFRRRENEHHAPEGQLPDPEGPRDPRRKTPPISMGLYLAAACSGLTTGKHGVFALMEPKLARRLRGFGIHFHQVGDGIEHRGLRAPFYISREDLQSRISPKVRGFLDTVCGDVKRGGGW